MSRKPSPVSARYRWTVASRIAAAVLGCYAFTAAATVLLTLLWPIPRPQAVLAANMLSFAIYAIAAIWVFTTRSVTRAWIGMVIPAAIMTGLSWLLIIGLPQGASLP